ncbi:MAG: DUF362 domain-containing protein [Endomicrobiales bacterium]|nr:DUF362 domain-containing protein [Endomicrobiales bacterium]
MDKRESGINRLMNRIFSMQYSRKGFLRFLGVFIGTLLLSSRTSRRLLAKTGKTLNERKKRQVKTDYDIAVAKGIDPYGITRTAIKTLGGMDKFVKKGDIVVIKPNIGWDRTPEQAGNTNPYVVETLVKMCFESGAKIVKVFDNTCNSARRTYDNSGIFDAVKRAGGTIFYVNDWKFYPGNFGKDAAMDEWPIFHDAVECDCFINVPIAKHHRLTELTLSMKNLMGVCGGSRGTMHWNIAQKLAEVTKFIKPDLTVIDAYRILLRNGPTGGDLADVEQKNTVIASTDPVLADSYATTLFGLKPKDIGYIKSGYEMGLGSMDISKAKLKEVEV